MRIQRYFALGLAWLSLAPCAFSQPPKQDDRALAAFQNALQRDGFVVSTGAAAALNLVTAWCGNTPGVDHALYANNQAYMQMQVPKSAQEPTMLNSIFQLGPEEAIVLIGLTPPPEKYFGFHPLLKTKVKPDGTRQPLWATLGDAVNNLTVKTTGPTPFNSPVALIFTPDQGTDTRVRAALQRAGYPAAIINTVVFPASMLNLGHGESADELFIAVRNAMWEKQADGDAYIRNPPLRVFRVTPRTQTTSNPFPAPRLRVRGTGQTEMDLMNKLGQLRQAIVTANPGLHATDIVSKPNWYEGYDYIQRGLDPWADSRDAFWLIAGYMPEYGLTEEITLADDEFLMVYGVNHVATGKATYHSVNVYSSKEGKVPIGGADDRAFSGTVTPYLPGDPAAANLMYAYKVSRTCGSQPDCVPLAIDACPRLTIGPNTVLGVIFRTYLEPATKVGAAMPEILYDRVIKFSPRPPAQP
jgi:hypothetical protein